MVASSIIQKKKIIYKYRLSSDQCSSGRGQCNY